ncbi:MAG: hypothetical protein NXI20_18425 [bacterium]|nr:hypothetical protein [bacterium]
MKFSNVFPLFPLLFVCSGIYSQEILLTIRNQDRVFYEKTVSDSLQRIGYYPTIRYEDSDGLRFINPQLGGYFNSKYVRSYNDGPTWTGKGFTADFSSGIQFKKGALRLTATPIVYFSQNSDFQLASTNSGQNMYNYQFGVIPRIDFVQRYGSASRYRFHLGQSELAFRTSNFDLAISTQNFLLGPASYNSILMSNSAEGFPYLSIGTNEKISLLYKALDFGKIDLRLYYGILKESDYFDSDSNNNSRYFNALSVGYEVPYLSGLYLGFNRTLYKGFENFSAEDLYSMFYIADSGLVIDDSGDTVLNTNDTFDQLASAYIEWKLKGQSMRLFFEFARNDFNGSIRRILQEFEHSRAYSLGLDKVFELNNGKDIYMSYEHTFLARYISHLYRPNPPFYSHGPVPQGYTHQGQVLGAAIGPGSISDLLHINLVAKRQIIGLKFQRIRFDEDYFVENIPNNQSKIDKHDIEYTLGLKYVNQSDNLQFGISSDLSYRFNMYYLPLNDKVNFYTRMFVTYLIR